MSIDHGQDAQEGMPQDYRGSLWVPPNVGFMGMNAAGQYPVDMSPVMDKHTEDNWTLKFPVSMGGLFVKSTAVMRPIVEGGSEKRQTFGLLIVRFFDPEYGPGDVGHLSREEYTAVRDHMTAVLEDSRF